MLSESITVTDYSVAVAVVMREEEEEEDGRCCWQRKVVGYVGKNANSAAFLLPLGGVGSMNRFYLCGRRRRRELVDGSLDG